jgi:arylsulfatase A-like enzyme
MPEPRRGFPVVTYLFTATFILTAIISLDRWIEGLKVFTDVSFIDLRNLVFYTLLYVLYDLVAAGLLALPLILWLRRSSPEAERTLPAAALTALPVFVVVTPLLLLALAYRKFDNELGTAVRVALYLALSAVFLALLVLLARVLRLPSRVAARAIGWRHASRNALLAAGAGSAFVLLAVLFAPQGAHSGKPAGPNVLLVVIDTLRRDFVGAYGSPLDTTPFIDRLAKEGILFEHPFSVAPTSVPGHTSILFGEGVEITKTLSNTFTVDPRLESIAEAMKRRGYFTFGVCANQLISIESGFGQGFDFYWERKQTFAHNAPLFFFAFVNPLSQMAMTALRVDLTNALARRFLHPAQQPFFGFVQYLHCHNPYTSHNDPPWRTPEHMARLQEMIRDGEFPKTTSWPLERDVWKTGKYAASIRYVDSLVRDLLKTMDERGILDDTVVIITADHGENLSEHGDKYANRHDSYFTTSLSVPLILWARDLPAAGTRVPGITGHDEVKDLVLDVTSGNSLVLSPRASARSLEETFGKDRHFAFTKDAFVLFEDSLKYVASAPQEEPFRKLFRWREDPWDRHDLLQGEDAGEGPAGSPARRRAEEMQEEVANIVAENRIIDAWSTKRELTGNQLRNLHALGYL